MRIIGMNGEEWDADEREPGSGSSEDPAQSAESVEGVLVTDEHAELIRARFLLAPVQKSMEAAGFYAYSTFDQLQRMTVASDDEAGRFDVWVEGGDYVLSLWTSDPGLFMDEENEWRRRAMERLARLQIPRLSQGMLASHQEAMWDDDDRGVAVRLTFRVPIERAAEVGGFIREHIPQLNELLEFVERQIA